LSRLEFDPNGRIKKIDPLAVLSPEGEEKMTSALPDGGAPTARDAGN
jgi:hypothetical protein